MKKRRGRGRCTRKWKKPEDSKARKRDEEEAERNKVPTITTLCNVCRDRERETERDTQREREPERERTRESARESERATSICHAVKCVNENSNNANVNVDVDVDVKAKRSQR